MSPPFGPPGGGGFGPPGGGGYGPPGGGYGGPPGGGGFGGAPPGGGGYGPPPGGGGYGGPPGGGYGGPPGGGFGCPPPPGFGGRNPRVTVEWEDKSLPITTRILRTIRDVSFSPTEFYQRAAAIDEPIHGVLGGVAGTAVGAIGFGLQLGAAYLIMGAIGFVAGGKASGGAGPAALAMGFLSVFAVIVYPLIITVNSFTTPWIQGGIVHLLLMLYKGASRPYVATVRVVGYSQATMALLAIPIVGMFIAPICHLISMVVGLSILHNTSVGKVLLALFTPAFVCCFCYAVTIGVVALVAAVSH